MRLATDAVRRLAALETENAKMREVMHRLSDMSVDVAVHLSGDERRAFGRIVNEADAIIGRTWLPPMNAEVKHTPTPGPWFAERNERRFNVWGRRGELLVAECGQEENTFSKANAHLIAAAPDMLAALKALINAPAIADEDHNDPTWGDGETAQAKSLALAAIARAGGRTP